jgi:hypothetical protein
LDLRWYAKHPSMLAPYLQKWGIALARRALSDRQLPKVLDRLPQSLR